MDNATGTSTTVLTPLAPFSTYNPAPRRLFAVALPTPSRPMSRLGVLRSVGQSPDHIARPKAFPDRFNAFPERFAPFAERIARPKAFREHFALLQIALDSCESSRKHYHGLKRHRRRLESRRIR